MKNHKPSYFTHARSWADDIYMHTHAENNRYKIALLLCMIIIIILVTCVSMLIPIQHIQPLLVHHYSDGTTTVERIKSGEQPTNTSETESDLVRYVINRESYSHIAFKQQYHLVYLLSSPSVAKQYRLLQSPNNHHAPINTLANKKYRTVHIDSVSFLDNVRLNKSKDHQHHRNLAQVDFNVITHSLSTEGTMTQHYRSIVSWQYVGAPSDPTDLWKNWSGFRVLYYQRSQRNVEVN